MSGTTSVASNDSASYVRLRFRSVGARYERYPDWIQSLRGASGVYVIRLRHGRKRRVVYVGESHGDRLYGTLTRHFQVWSRQKRFWRGQYSAHDPGLTYPRALCDAAALVTPADRAIEIQNALIRWLRPRDNIVGAETSGNNWGEAPSLDGDSRPTSDDAVPF